MNGNQSVPAPLPEVRSLAMRDSPRRFVPAAAKRTGSTNEKTEIVQSATVVGLIYTNVRGE